MTGRRKYARTIAGAFDSLTLDGRRLEGMALQRRADALRRKGTHEGWGTEVARVITELAHGGASLEATTSGTTGPPKAIRIPRRDLVNSARLTADTFGLNAGDRALLCLPCAYIAGKMMLVRAMALGLDLHIIDPRGSVLDHLEVDDRFRFTAMVPLQLHRAVQEDRARVEALFDTILLGGGPVSTALEEDVQGLRTAVYQGYGSTETVTHVALRRINGPERSLIYQALGRVSFGTDDRGCLIVHTPHLRRKQYITNDLVDLVDRTHFRWAGRVDHVILSGGKKIHPEQLEARTAAVVPYPHYFIPVPDDRLGQAVALVVETALDADGVGNALRPLLRQVLSEHEMPRRILTMPTFRRTASGKIIRHPAS